jgi:hypothetical protein
VSVVEELACAEEVWEEGVVVEAPYAVGSGGLKEVEDLYSTCDCEVSGINMRVNSGILLIEYYEYEGLVVILVEDMKLPKTKAGYITPECTRERYSQQIKFSS